MVPEGLSAHPIATIPPLGEATSADVIVGGHALVRNLRTGFSALTVQVPIKLRLAVAWPQLAQVI